MEALQAPFSTTSEPSPYRPIDSDGGEVRLVELSPGGYGDPISLSLCTIKLKEQVNDQAAYHEHSDSTNSDDEESHEGNLEKGGSYGSVPLKQGFSRRSGYEALSYAWGTAISPLKVRVDGTDMSITENLDQGLRRLRLDDQPRVLWIDAICINQRDAEERSHQVQHMATIYRSAKQLLIWLGEWPISTCCLRPADCQMLWRNTVGGKDWREVPSLPRHIYQHFTEIVALPWFSRLWIIQELALAKTDPAIMIGSLTIRWSDFASAIDGIVCYQWLHVPKDLRGRLESGVTQLLSLDVIRCLSDRHRGLYWCLFNSQCAVATDPRDKVYGLLGLCDFQVTEPIAADYSKPLQQVLAEATLVSLLEESAFTYLAPNAFCPDTFDQDRYGSSWVIDFSSMQDWHGYFIEVSPRLSLEERHRRRNSAYLSAHGLTLHVYGRYVGTVCGVHTRILTDRPTHKIRSRIPDTEIYDFHHNFLKARGITPRTLLDTIRRKSTKDEDVDQFASLLSSSREVFCADSADHGILCRDLLVTREGHLGISWHPNRGLIHVGAILVYLFGAEVPFILAPVPGTQSYEMINVAYVPGYGNRILEDPYQHSLRATWIDFAAEGGQEYAIV